MGVHSNLCNRDTYYSKFVLLNNKKTKPKNIWLGLQIGKVNEAPLLCLIAMILSSLGCIALFIFADSIFQLLLPIVGNV